MPIVLKPRQICIDIDQETGAPAGISKHYIRVFEDGGIIVHPGVHVETFQMDSQQARDILGDLAASSISDLARYQEETQRLGRELNIVRKELDDLKKNKK